VVSFSTLIEGVINDHVWNLPTAACDHGVAGDLTW